MATMATGHGRSSRALLAAVTVMSTSLCAAVIAVGAVLVAVGLTADQPVASLGADLARSLAGPLDGWLTVRTDAGVPDAERMALVNWGLAALGYLVVGRAVQRLLGD